MQPFLIVGIPITIVTIVTKLSALFNFTNQIFFVYVLHMCTFIVMYVFHCACSFTYVSIIRHISLLFNMFENKYFVYICVYTKQLKERITEFIFFGKT